ncbi:MAG: hypothetical protein AAGD22_03190 [Verrucomicrobiota bacterium]
MAIVEKWNIKARAHHCSKTEQKFSEGEPFYTALFEDPNTDGFLRRDYSEAAWEELQDSLKPFSFWRSTYEPPPAEDTGPIVEKQTAESLLRRLIEEDEAHTENARYVLAVMLERDKKLRQTDTQQTKNGKYLIYELRESGEVIIVKDPKLHLEEVEPIQDEVSQLLGAPPRVHGNPEGSHLPGSDPASPQTSPREKEEP